MKKCLIRQPAGIGDILFCQKIASKLRKKGYEIWWPVSDQIRWVENYISGINFCSIDDNFPLKENYYNSNSIIDDNGVFLPLQDADQHYAGMCMMDAKYEFTGLKYNDWQNYLKYSRNYDKESELFDLLSPPASFSLVNKKFGTPPGEQTCKHIDTVGMDNVIELRIIEGYNIFDWCRVFEKASEIHTVDTSILFLIETLNVTNDLHCYSRFDPPSFVNVKHLFNKPWTYIQ
jgi:hypothetical protein